ncbi:crotonase/enoyl-CoA hydratase family protein [Ilumatobacter nonamiensis]|uniref:crotonase/enoyl-CoA hydratase family protein n=1 Tax=Ilumatobacter nonamiensis TaxID=467093 RepID=UPI00058B064B|nr:crotonase/enoyl-CoA hydratase family protein [Ilumatobacter nonamiensis]
MSTQAVSTERLDGGVLLCHIDDGKANALSKDIIASVLAALDEAESDDSVTSFVVHGREGKFSAGFDLNVMRSGDLAAMSDLVSDGGELVRRLYDASVPVVAACTGHALAAGALVLLGCDVRVGADIDCKIGLNEVAIGMVLPDWAFTISLARLSNRHVQRSVATARITNAADAVDVGYLDEVAPADQVLDVAVARAAEFAALHPGAYRGTVAKLRGEVVSTMAAQIAADRSAGATPTV